MPNNQFYRLQRPLVVAQNVRMSICFLILKRVRDILTVARTNVALELILVLGWTFCSTCKHFFASSYLCQGPSTPFSTFPWQNIWFASPEFKINSFFEKIGKLPFVCLQKQVNEYLLTCKYIDGRERTIYWQRSSRSGHWDLPICRRKFTKPKKKNACQVYIKNLLHLLITIVNYFTTSRQIRDKSILHYSETKFCTPSSRLENRMWYNLFFPLPPFRHKPTNYL